MPDSKPNKKIPLKGLKITPALHKMIDRESAESGLPMYRLVELAWDKYVSDGAPTVHNSDHSPVPINLQKEVDIREPLPQNTVIVLQSVLGQISDLIQTAIGIVCESAAAQDVRPNESTSGTQFAEDAARRAREIRDSNPGGKNYPGRTKGGAQKPKPNAPGVGGIGRSGTGT